MIINKKQVDSYDIRTDSADKIRKIILKHGINTEEYPIEYDKNGNLMRIGAEWVSYGSISGVFNELEEDVRHEHCNYQLIEILKKPTLTEEGLGLYKCGYNRPTVTNDTTYVWNYDESTSIWSSNTVGVNSSTTNLTFSYTFTEDTTVSFDYSVSSERSYDYIYYTIYKDGSSYAGGTSTKISGTSYGTLSSGLTWQNVTLDVPSGEYQITFTYKKDYSDKSGDDKGYVKMYKIGETCEHTCTMPIPKLELETLEFTGTNFNQTMKRLSSGDSTVSSYTTDQNITNIEFVDYEDFIIDNAIALYNSTTNKYLLMSIKNTTIQLYSEDELVVLPEDCANMFYRISNVTALSLNRFDTSNVKNMLQMFCGFGYVSLTSLDLGDNFNTSNVTNMQSMFFDCGYAALNSLYLGDKFDTSNVTNMLQMFYDCGYTSMTSLDLGDKFDTSNVTNMEDMFARCGYKGMTSLDLGDKFDTSNVTNMEGMFARCGYTSMTSLDLGDKFDTSNVTDMSRMFNYCGYTALNSLYLGEKFNTSNVADMSYMFEYCGYTSMTSLDLGKSFVYPTVSTSVYDSFYGAGTSDVKIYVNEETYNRKGSLGGVTRSSNFVIKY